MQVIKSANKQLIEIFDAIEVTISRISRSKGGTIKIDDNNLMNIAWKWRKGARKVNAEVSVAFNILKSSFHKKKQLMYWIFYLLWTFPDNEAY